MATKAPATKANAGGPPGKPEEWTEEQLQDALEQLKVIHIKCRELRTTIPRMLEPLTKKQISQLDSLASLQKSIASAVTELQDFKALYNNDETQKILEQAKQSRQAQPKDIKPWRARDHPDWLDLDENSTAGLRNGT